LAQKQGIEVAVVNSRFAKPLDREFLLAELPRYPVVCTIEDNTLVGGFGAAVTEFVNDEEVKLARPLKRFGAPDYFVPHATQSEQYQLCGYDPESVFFFLENVCQPRRIAAVG
jgi:1-deoxy-D-xylulose-5-phosphate synthase